MINHKIKELAGFDVSEKTLAENYWLFQLTKGPSVIHISASISLKTIVSFTLQCQNQKMGIQSPLFIIEGIITEWRIPKENWFNSEKSEDIWRKSQKIIPQVAPQHILTLVPIKIIGDTNQEKMFENKIFKIEWNSEKRCGTAICAK